MRASVRRGVGVLVFAAAAVLAAVALYLFAAALTTRALDQAARADLGAYAAGRSPWHWTLRRPDDVVAGHAFGKAVLSAHDGALQVRSLDGSAWDIGLPLERDADLQHASRLRVVLSTTQPLHAWLEVRQHLQSPVCLASVPAPVGAATTWQLDTLAWRHFDGQACASPTRAALLRLRVQQPAGSVVTLTSAALLARANLRVADLPLVRLPAHGSPQRLLALRDLAYAAAPGAVVVPHRFDAAAPRPAAAAEVTPWAILGIYALVLLGLAMRPPPRPWRAWLDVAACMAGPLWLIAGLHLGEHTAPVYLIAFALAIAYAAWLQMRERRPAHWHWLGDARAWLAPWLVLPVAVLLALAFAHGWRAPGALHVAAYLAWAALQQWLMLAVVLRRLENALPWAAGAMLVTALLFALLHTPNARLMLLCFGAELWWAWCFRRGRAVLPIAAAHAACALLLQATLAGGWLRSLEVGARYFLAP
ncbi:MAG TPA: CPBP family intramembrane glutamic endopeptidase [Rhodanobacteraceae bacterium]|nr:CPBP family intramembrane glutamic endopeptidase [Rhodanobacteraceae bacterium]